MFLVIYFSQYILHKGIQSQRRGTDPYFTSDISYTNCNYRGSSLIDLPDATKRGDMSFTGKRKKIDGTSNKKIIMSLISEEQVLPRVEEEEIPLTEVGRNDPPKHVVREEPVEGCKINVPS